MTRWKSFLLSFTASNVVIHTSAVNFVLKQIIVGILFLISIFVCQNFLFVYTAKKNLLVTKELASKIWAILNIFIYNGIKIKISLVPIRYIIPY